MSTPKILSVSSNIKSADGSPRSYDLGEKTLIVGPNGSGKSAIVQAVSLAVSGAAEEVAGRAVTSDPALLMTLAHQHGHDGSVVFARVNLDNGEHCQWETSRDGSHVKTPAHIRPRWVIPHTSKQHSPHFPLRDVREVLTGAPKKARERFLAWVCADLDNKTVEAALGGDYEQYLQLTAGCDDLVPVDRLTHSIDTADKTARKLRAEAKAQAQLRDKLLSEVGVRPADAAVLAARDAVREAQELHEAALLSAGAGDSRRRRELLHSLLGQLRADEQRLLSQVAEEEALLSDLEESESVEVRGSVGALHALEWAMSLSADSCPICSSPVGAQHVSACRDFYAHKVEDAAARDTRRREATAGLASRQAQLSAVRQKIAMHEDELDAMPAHNPNDEGVSVDQTRDALSAAQAKLNALNAAASQWKTLQAAKNLVDVNHATAETFSRYKKAAQDVVSRLLDEKVESFCAKVSSYLPEGWEFGVMVTDNGRDAFYYGLYEGRGESRYLKVGLSEAQRVTVTLAMCAALDDMLPLPLAVLAPEDRGWDAQTLGEVMQAFKRVKQTVLLTSTVMPASDYLKGWKVIDLRKAATPRLRLPAPSLPEDDGDEVQVTHSLPKLPDELSVRAAPTSGRARGGMFRSLRIRVSKYVVEHGLEAARHAFRLAHPDLVVEDETSPDAFAEAAANFLVPIGPQ
jgi:energy-coupling factor transporter ATP-binding protein EcfA2